jgi:hypothetical protein
MITKGFGAQVKPTLDSPSTHNILFRSEQTYAEICSGFKS